jgi:hypothetical protein
VFLFPLKRGESCLKRKEQEIIDAVYNELEVNIVSDRDVEDTVKLYVDELYDVSRGDIKKKHA